MANKEKLLASAQKSLQKGQIAKAIKDFQKIVELDPKDVRNRQKLAELFSRVKNNEQALSEYEAVAKYYAENGFYLKSIAVYKQMQKLEPSLVHIYHRLAELNEKQGLKGNALAEYRSLVSYYEKQRMVPETINILQKMRDVDPENLNIRVKIAETFVQAKMTDKARAEVFEVRKFLMQKKDFAKVLKLFEIFLPMFPKDSEMLLGQAQALIAKGDIERGLEVLQQLSAGAADNPEILRALVRAYRQREDFASALKTFERLLKLQPEDLELREGFIQASLDAGKEKQALEHLEEWKEKFLDGGRVASLKAFYERLEKALPGNGKIANTLHSIYEVTGEGDKLFDFLSSAPASESGSLSVPGGEALSGTPTLDDSLLDEAVEDLEPLDELELPSAGLLAGADSGSRHAPGAEPQETAAREEQETQDFLEEIPLEFLEEDSGDAGGELVEAESLELELELELEDDLDDLEAACVPAEDFLAEEPEVIADAEVGSAHDDLESVELALDADDDLLDLDLDAALSETSGGESKPDIATDLEEAEFYLQQGLLDDAERVCRSILEADPACRQAQAKLEEIDKKKLSTQASPGESAGAAGPGASGKPAAKASARADRFGLDTALGEFKKGVQSQIDVDDCESHYNLGIAYKEMGLLDDAIAEFDHALRNPDRRVDCLTLKGVCLISKGDFDGAEAAFKAGLGSAELSDGEKISLQYELGLLYETSGKPQEALDCFLFVADCDLFYRNVGDRVAAVRKQLGKDDQEGKASGKALGNKDRVSYV
ncbi:hypothetical protein DESUT3_22270 [Desulfuromonas versatilis]|uniref:Tetratricopeptide repeat protein n=1 Tax=Desulfuromonas versatilis TaxID=2802975 RepID=A0ABM8HS97_9BACT|nr:tetratricopeptide repeat protein [Desulfuromonas versatilis]BCR05158.1 hypothetical protein DESUT3_22270 [Desulfuromonas versatilis]